MLSSICSYSGPPWGKAPPSPLKGLRRQVRLHLSRRDRRPSSCHSFSKKAGVAKRGLFCCRSRSSPGDCARRAAGSPSRGEHAPRAQSPAAESASVPLQLSYFVNRGGPPDTCAHLRLRTEPACRPLATCVLPPPGAILENRATCHSRRVQPSKIRSPQAIQFSSRAPSFRRDITYIVPSLSLFSS